MQNRNDLFRYIGLGSTPWAIRAYIMLLVFFTLLSFVASQSPMTASLATLAMDGLKSVLGALLGSLALVGEKRLCEREGRVE